MTKYRDHARANVVQFRIGRKVSLAEFRRLRRQFLKITQLNPVCSQQIGDAFVTYLVANHS